MRTTSPRAAQPGVLRRETNSLELYRADPCPTEFGRRRLPPRLGRSGFGRLCRPFETSLSERIPASTVLHRPSGICPAQGVASSWAPAWREVSRSCTVAMTSRPERLGICPQSALAGSSVVSQPSTIHPFRRFQGELARPLLRGSLWLRRPSGISAAPVAPTSPTVCWPLSSSLWNGSLQAVRFPAAPGAVRAPSSSGNSPLFGVSRSAPACNPSVLLRGIISGYLGSPESGVVRASADHRAPASHLRSRHSRLAVAQCRAPPLWTPHGWTHS